MSKALATVTFDYSKVDKDTKGKLMSLLGQLKRYGGHLREAANHLGKAICEAHSLLSPIRSGMFEEWIESETDVSLSTAYNCINVEKRLVDFPILENLPPTVAYMLAAPKVPDAAIKAFEKQLGNGVRPTVAAAKATLDKFRDLASKEVRVPPRPGTPIPKPEQPAEPEDNDDPNEHVREQIRNEEATGDMNKPAPPPEPDWKGLLDLVGQVRRAADTCNKLTGRKGKFCDDFQTTCGILDDIVRDWRKATK